MNYKSCFILMPFTKAGGLNKDDLDYVYTYIIKKAVEEFELEGQKYFQRVERYNSSVGSIISGIVNQLNTADLVIADLTGLNSNVMYELGVRHALKRGTITITQDFSNFPSDLRDYMTVVYKYSQKTTEQAKNYETFKADLHKSISELLSTNKYDSPVLSYLELKQRFRDETAIERLKENAVISETIFEEYYEIESMIEELVKSNYDNANTSLNFHLFILKLNNLLTAVNELNLSHESSILYQSIVDAKTILGEINKMFTMNEYFQGLSTLDGIPTEIFNNIGLKACIEDRKFVNLFDPIKNEELQLINMRNLFSKDGVLLTEFLDFLEDYIEDKAKELGIEKELQKILQS